MQNGGINEIRSAHCSVRFALKLSGLIAFQFPFSLEKEGQKGLYSQPAYLLASSKFDKRYSYLMQFRVPQFVEKINFYEHFYYSSMRIFYFLYFGIDSKI